MMVLITRIIKSDAFNIMQMVTGGLDFDKQYTTVQEYAVLNNFDRIYTMMNMHHRDVKIKAVSEYDYLGIYKLITAILSLRLQATTPIASLQKEVDY
jgi:hypothetical protein